MTVAIGDYKSAGPGAMATFSRRDTGAVDFFISIINASALLREVNFSPTRDLGRFATKEDLHHRHIRTARGPANRSPVVIVTASSLNVGISSVIEEEASELSVYAIRRKHQGGEVTGVLQRGFGNILARNMLEKILRGIVVKGVVWIGSFF